MPQTGIGNRHAPLFRGDSPGEYPLPFDAPLKALLESLGYAAQELHRRILTVALSLLPATC
jgi:urease accessory protein UreE